MINRRFSFRVRNYAAVAAGDYTIVYDTYKTFLNKKGEKMQKKYLSKPI